MNMIFILLAYLLAIAKAGCPAYVCSKTLPQDVCAVSKYNESRGEISLKKCPLETQFCPLETIPYGETRCIRSFPKSVYYPGEHCIGSEECFSKNCSSLNGNQICIGKDKDEKCESDIDCNPKLYCKSGTCQDLVPLKGACSFELKCSVTAVCDNGFCVRKGKKPAGDPATTPASCSTFFLNNGKCSKAPVYKPRPNAEEEKKMHCPPDRLCMYEQKEEGIAFNETCTCGMSNGTNEFCNYGRGDIDISKYNEYMEMKEPEERCHILRGPLCFYDDYKKMPDEFYFAYVAYMKIMKSAELMDNSDCVKDVINYIYWEGDARVNKEEIGSRTAIVICLVVLLIVGGSLILAMVFIYLKKHKGDSDSQEEKGKINE